MVLCNFSAYTAIGEGGDFNEELGIRNQELMVGVAHTHLYELNSKLKFLR